MSDVYNDTCTRQRCFFGTHTHTLASIFASSEARLWLDTKSVSTSGDHELRAAKYTNTLMKKRTRATRSINNNTSHASRHIIIFFSTSVFLLRPALLRHCLCYLSIISFSLFLALSFSLSLIHFSLHFVSLSFFI